MNLLARDEVLSILAPYAPRAEVVEPNALFADRRVRAEAPAALDHPTNRGALGVYAIVFDGLPLYIGCAHELSARVRAHVLAIADECDGGSSPFVRRVAWPIGLAPASRLARVEIHVLRIERARRRDPGLGDALLRAEDRAIALLAPEGNRPATANPYEWARHLGLPAPKPDVLVPDPPPPPKGGDRAMTVREVARFLSVSEAMIYRMVKDEDLPAIKRGRRIYIDSSDVRNLIYSVVRPRTEGELR